MNHLVDALAPGQRVWVSTMNAESALLRDELAAQPDRARGVTFMGVQFPGIDRTDYLAFHPEARLWGCFMSPAMREGLRNGRAELLAADYSGLARHLHEMPPVDLAIAQLTLPDTDGWCSSGVASDFLPLAWARAHRRIAHLNPRMPRTRGSFRVHVSELDASVTAEAEVGEFRERPAGPLEAAIAGHVARLVRDGDTLQFGIGGVPLALAGALRAHRGLRLHAGMVTEALRTLWEAGALDRDARITTGAILGGADLQTFAAELPHVWMTDVRETHDVCRIGAIPRFVAINGAVEVDLFGQVNAERAQGAIQAGAGGLPAFAAGAQRSAGGRLVICLPASAKSGAVSRIVPVIGDQGLVTVPRQLCDAVVTEHGVAQVRGLPLDARAEALIAIAAPEHRAALADAWRAMRSTF